jgi:hypothetical protein
MVSEKSSLSGQNSRALHNIPRLAQPDFFRRAGIERRARLFYPRIEVLSACRFALPRSRIALQSPQKNSTECAMKALVRACCFAIAVSSLPMMTRAFAITSIDPPDAQAVLSTTAAGVQIYSCEYDANHALGWKFVRPSATLYDAHGAAVIQHGAGPSWQANDGTRIVGSVIAQLPSDTPGSVPQLLLAAKSTGARGELGDVRYVRRSQTVGGAMPAAACDVEHAQGSSPYLATYTFYR